MKTGKGVKKDMHTDEEYTGRRFEVTITEVYQRKIMVSEGEMKEPSAAEAGRMVVDWWQDEQIILGTDDFQGIEVTAKEVTAHGEGNGKADADGGDNSGGEAGPADDAGVDDGSADAGGSEDGGADISEADGDSADAAGSGDSDTAEETEPGEEAL